MRMTPRRHEEGRSKPGDREEPSRVGHKKKLFALGPKNIFLSFFHIWALKILAIALKSDHGDRIKLSLMREDTSKESSALLEKQLEKLPGGDLTRGWKILYSTRLEQAMHITFRSNLALMALWRALWMLPILFSSYWLFKIIIRYFANMDGAPTLSGIHITAVGVFLCHLTSVAGYHKFMHAHLKTGVQCRAALIPLVYKKSMQSAVVADTRFEVANIISKDCNIATESIISSVNFWLTIPECAAISALALYEFGLLAVPAVVFIFLICLPLQVLTSWNSCMLILKETAAFAERSKALLEILTLIRMIKMYVWEDHYKRRLQNLTKREIHKIRILVFIKSCELFLSFYAPLVCIFATFITTSIVDPSLLSPLYVFTAMSIFSVLRYPLVHFPYSYRSIRVARNSFKILDEYLSMEVYEAPLTSTPPPHDDPNLMCEMVSLYLQRLDVCSRLLL